MRTRGCPKASGQTVAAVLAKDCSQQRSALAGKSARAQVLPGARRERPKLRGLVDAAAADVAASGGARPSRSDDIEGATGGSHGQA